jgi:hypothetical protein
MSGTTKSVRASEGCKCCEVFRWRVLALKSQLHGHWKQLKHLHAPNKLRACIYVLYMLDILGQMLSCFLSDLMGFKVKRGHC